MPFPVPLLLLAVLGGGILLAKGLSSAAKATAAPGTPSSPTDATAQATWHTEIVNGVRIYDAPTAAKILASLALYSTTGLDHQVTAGQPNRAALTYRGGAIQEGNDRGLQFAILENQNGNAILAPANLWGLPTQPASMILVAVDPKLVGLWASPTSGRAVLVLDTGVLGKYATLPSTEAMTALTASAVVSGPSDIPAIPGGVPTTPPAALPATPGAP